MPDAAEPVAFGIAGRAVAGVWHAVRAPAPEAERSVQAAPEISPWRRF